MAEFTAAAIQTVAANQNVLLTDAVVGGNCSIVHRDDSGLVTLRGITNGQNRARFKATFSGNIAIPTGGVVGPIALALALNGEGVASTAMISTPAAVDSYNNVSGSIFVDVPAGCCVQLSVKNIPVPNTTTAPVAINVQNANLIVERVA